MLPTFIYRKNFVTKKLLSVYHFSLPFLHELKLIGKFRGTLRPVSGNEENAVIQGASETVLVQVLVSSFTSCVGL